MIKRVYKTLYAHKSNVNELLNETRKMKFKYINKIIDLVNNNTTKEYDVLKVDLIKNTISFITCEDWDNELEPTLKTIETHNIINGSMQHCLPLIISHS